MYAPVPGPSRSLHLARSLRFPHGLFTLLPRLILASGSPRRREMLSRLGLEFTVRAIDLDETPLAGEPAEAMVRRLALAKARAIAESGELILAADTVVVLEGDLLGKPRDSAAAVATLTRLAGREHTVATGVALFEPDAGGGRERVTVEVSRVRMAPMNELEVAWYVGTGEPLDRAGSYAIQGHGALFVDAVDGNYSNVVGLPLPATYRLFREMGYDLLQWAAGDGLSRPP